LSVPTIREALRTLEQEGYISKKHGMGNYYHASTLETRMRIDTILDFSDLLADGGYGVRVSQTELRLLSAPTAAAGRERELSVRAGPLYRYDRVYSADDRPAILTRNYIPQELLDPQAERAPAPKENIIDVLWSQGRIRVTHSIEAMTPGLADSAERALFGLKARSPLIRWSETFYTYDDSIVGYADVSFNPDIMNMRLLRKWS
jgi:GntR family transcriptional regulator